MVWWGLPSGWKLITKSAFTEFHAPLWDLSSRIQDLSFYWGHMSDSKKTLIEKARINSRIMSDQSLQKDRYRTLEREEQRLRELKARIAGLNNALNLDSGNAFKPVVSRVSLRTLNGWWQGIRLRKGRDMGFEKGMGVIFKGGVVGRINEVGRRSSEVQLLTHPNFRIAARFEDDDRPVTFQGNGILPGGKAQGLVMDVPQDLHASKEKPLTLTTSSLGANFPEGIPIGKVFELEGGEDGLFKIGQVSLNENLSSILEVTVLTRSTEHHGQ